ncbi:MAG: DUF2807 domain-containing protein [Burkholderiales bacterium]|nr:DUF2807 domain-containing protein [Burkholderiales bacterium]
MNTPATPAPSRRRVWILASVAVLLAGTAAVAAALSASTVTGNGVLRKHDRPASGITAIELALPAEVEVRIGTNEGVSIETDENLLPLISAKVDNGVLELDTTDKKVDLKPSQMKIVVTAREIRQLSVAGGGSIRAAALKSPRLELEIAGSGLIDLQKLETDNVSAEIAGNGNIRVAGNAGKLEIDIAGSGDVRANELKAMQAEVSIAGSGKATLWPVDGLKVSIAGSGDVRYWGDPTTRTSVAGSGSIQRMGPAPR